MIKPHGGQLVTQIASDSQKEELLVKAKNLKKITLTDRYIADCEMIANGGYSPLTGFMNKKTVEYVLDKMELPNGLTWTIPVVLPLPSLEIKNIKLWDDLALYDKGNRLIALINVDEIFMLNLDRFCQQVFNTTKRQHPGVNFTKLDGRHFVSGKIKLVNRPQRVEINTKYFLDPTETRSLFKKKNWQTIVAFQTRNPIHRAHEYIIKAAVQSLDGVLIHPLVGTTKSDDVPPQVRMKCCKTLIDKYFNLQHTMLSVLPAAMHYAGPREAIHHMIIRQNYGCSHMIIGRDHAGVGDYYGTYEAQDLARQLTNKLEIKPLMFEHSYYCKVCKNYGSVKTCPHTANDRIHLSGTAVRAMLRAGDHPPVHFTRPEVAKILVDWAKQASGINLFDILKIAQEAGQAIMQVYNSTGFNVTIKTDKSPLTKADQDANQIITDQLSRLYPHIPILSEEGRKIPYEKRKDWEFFWLVDPLDGTKEFIKRNDEFTVNIALIHHGKSTLGVVYAPVLKTFYFAQRQVGAFKLTLTEDHANQLLTFKTSKDLFINADKLPLKKNKKEFVITTSRSHLNEDTQQFINKLKKKHGRIKIISAGSSIKLCLIAEGKADIYPRLAPTMEWDTGAGQAIVEIAGGQVINQKTGKSLIYNKENLVNPKFVVEL